MPAVKLTTQTSADFFETNKDAIVLLFFDAEFSGQQDVVEETIKAVEASADLENKIVVASVDVETNNDLATKYSVLSVPMVACVKGDKVFKKIDTLEPSKLVNIVKEVLNLLELASGDESVEHSVDIKARFKEYLKKLTTRAPVMIFMKGAPQQPRCGFSRQLVELLAKHKIVYESFDILQDEEVRQGLKEYSDWPTYPQIYANGEFVGGLDILKQMEESGELESTLKASS